MMLERSLRHVSALVVLATSVHALPQATTRISVSSSGAQGNAHSAFGDGLRCIGGTLKRLYAKAATAGSVSAPGASDNPITVQSALLGDPIAPGSTRYYQTYCRDPSPTFCPTPAGNTWNISSAATITW